MRELVLQMGVSIDGYVATIDGAHDWGYDGEDPATKNWSSTQSAARERRAPDGPADVRGHGRGLAGVVKRLRRADERDPEGGVLEDARARRVAGVADRGRGAADEIAQLKAVEGGYLLAHGERASLFMAGVRRPLRGSLASSVLATVRPLPSPGVERLGLVPRTEVLRNG
jgi:hypothetical protein